MDETWKDIMLTCVQCYKQQRIFLDPNFTQDQNIIDRGWRIFGDYNFCSKSCLKGTTMSNESKYKDEGMGDE